MSKPIEINTLQDLENFINQHNPQEPINIICSDEILLLIAGYGRIVEANEELPFEISLTQPLNPDFKPLVLKGYTSTPGD